MVRFALATVLLMIVGTPSFAQAPSTASGAAAPPVGAAGAGPTTSTTSGPEMKTGAERSPTAGAPTGAGVATGTRN